jgi:hypothetical protein
MSAQGSNQHGSTTAVKKTRVRKLKPPRTTEQYAALSEKFQSAVRRATEALSKMRKDGLSLRAASRESGISPASVTRWAGSALKKAPNGRYVARPGDQLLRVMKIPTPAGQREIGVRGSRQASMIGQYWAALHKYLNTGDTTGLKKFTGKSIKADTGESTLFLTDAKELKRLGYAGVLSFESLYARAA